MRPIDADVLIPLIQEDKIEGKTLDIVKALGDGLQAETLNQACDRHIKIINGLPTIATTQEVHGTAENFTAPMEKGKTMTTKEKILLYFRDINCAYNDSTRLDSLEKGLAELEEVVRCKDCKHLFTDFVMDGKEYKRCEMQMAGFHDDWFCADGERKEDPT